MNLCDCWVLMWSRWSQLPNLCAHAQKSCERTEKAAADTVDNIKNLYKSLISALNLHGNSDLKRRFLEFIYEQFVSLYVAQKWYSPSFLDCSVCRVRPIKCRQDKADKQVTVAVWTLANQE